MSPSPVKTWIFFAFALLGLVAITVALLMIRSEPNEPAVEEVVVPEPEPERLPVIEQTIGTSVEGRAINAVTFGNGDTHLLFVGGMHGGYEWNSVLLAYQFIDYLDADQTRIPKGFTVSVIPKLNPDGLYKVVGVEGRFSSVDIPAGTDAAPGRFNANQVDLNRNFDCKWAPTSSWRGAEVSAGSGPFSEPEAAALRDFVVKTNPDAVVFWHSQANNVYASECESGPLAETLDIMDTYAAAANYGAVPSFDAYPITGDAEGWLASLGIPAITVELETRESIEWERNIAGVNALLEYYASSTSLTR